MLPRACAPQVPPALDPPSVPSTCATPSLASRLLPPSAAPAAISFSTSTEQPPASTAVRSAQHGVPASPGSDASTRYPSKPSDSIEVQLAAPSTPFHCDPPPPLARTTPRDLRRLFRDMTVIRRAEIASDMLFKAQAVRGFCHLYDGQEAVAVGMEAAMAPRDALITAYRDHGFFLSRGGSLQELFAELMGRCDGCARGKGGSMHLYSVARGFYGGWGIVGTSPPLGAGIALGQKLAGQQGESITAAVYGDGAANQGQVYEAMNMAALWRLPVVFVVENNHYGMGTSERRASAQTSFFDRVKYIPGLLVDGMDVLAVKQAMEYAKQHAISKGPMVLEMDTYRYHGHSMSDPGSSYRQRTEIQHTRRARDPIERVRRLMLEHEVESEEGLRQAERRMRAEVDAAVQAAREAAAPNENDLWQRVYRLDKGMVFSAPVVSEQRVEMP
ncbi:hypothetical protein CLOM_g10792 [Closterium sp. NIES-68]|nr:hypothetical protein CLOM_g10792 [Closterium sp. NIES-68]GJP58635.1 hypothetical protein CLOP_g1024 [Closterium sp. NIES-67]